jgi:dihydroflavonol-4-reductase
MILVTGATGLLGAHVVEAALRRRERIRAVSREVPQRSFLATVADRVEVAATDLCSPTLPDELFDGVDTVIHCAALASPFSADEPRMMALNVDATIRLFDSASRAGVGRFVQVSSIATIQDHGRPRDTAYARSKAIADRALDERKAHLPVLSVHPTFMLGAWDARPSSGGLLLALRMGKLTHYVDNVKNVAAASDVATGIWQALARGATGHYVLGGVDLAISDLLAEVCRRIGVDPDTLSRVPSLAELDRSSIAETERAIIRELCAPSSADSADAIRDFGYSPTRELAPVLEETLSYFSEYKMLRPIRPRASRQ